MAKKVLHIISQAHLDPVWLWPQRDGIAEALTTMQSAVDRAGEFPQFKFTRSSAAVYRWAKTMDPVLFASIQRLVAEGRWEVIGGMIEQPDCNLPSGESFIRQSIYAKRFFKEHFGEAGDTRIAYVPDSFGHGAGLPQLLRQGGFDAYVFMRPQPADGVDLPLLFQWESPDGSRVLCIRIPIQYSQSYAATADDVEAVVRASATQGFAPGFDNGAMWFGVGNHGGGPTIEHLERLHELQSDTSLPEIRFSTVREFMVSVQAEAAYAELPIVDRELQFVFRGCYAANGETKRQHRRAEQSLFAAESLAAIEGNHGLNLSESWWQLGFNQFHDILAGTCIAGAQQQICDSFGQVVTTAGAAINQAAFRIARRVDTSGESGSVLTVVNPFPHEREATVELDTFEMPHGREVIVALEAPDGSRHPVQWAQADANFGPWGLPWGKLTATLPLPASGYRVFRVITEAADEHFVNPFGGEESVSTEQFKKPAGSGQAKRARRREVPPLNRIETSDGLNLLRTSPYFEVVQDSYSTWGHGLESFDEAAEKIAFESVEEIESGPVLTVTRHRASWKQSKLVLDVRRHSISGEIEFKLRFNWQQSRETLRLCLPTMLDATDTVALNAGAVVVRPADGSEQPCHSWAALRGSLEGASAWMAVANDSTYSFSGQGSTLCMTLARGVPYAEHPPFEYEDISDLPLLDQGWQERRFMLRAGQTDWSAHTIQAWAQLYQQSVVALLDSRHSGSEPYEKSILQVDADALLVHACKLIDEGEGVVLRVQEIRGEVLSTNLTWKGTSFEIQLHPWQIASFHLSDQTLTRIKPVNPLA